MKRREKEGEEERRLRLRVLERGDEGQKRLAKRDFSNFLCVLSSFPGYSAESRTGRSVLSTCRFITDTGVNRGIDAARKCKGSFLPSPIVSSLIIERRESETRRERII